jgi:hypothetical protein
MYQFQRLDRKIDAATAEAAAAGDLMLLCLGSRESEVPSTDNQEWKKNSNGKYAVVWLCFGQILRWDPSLGPSFGSFVVTVGKR